MENNNRSQYVSRRKLLQTSGVSLAGSPLLISTVSGNEQQESCAECPDHIKDTDTATYYRVSDENGDHMIKKRKDTNTIEVAKVSSNDDTLKSASSQIALEESQYSTTARSYDSFSKRIGSCSSYYNNHYYKGANIITDENPHTISTSVLGGMICAALPIPGGRIAAIFAGGFCSGLAALVQEIIYDSSFTVGVWDRDSWRVPGISYGVGDHGSNYYELTRDGTATGVHTGSF
ncbi:MULTISPECIES: hypothetical protein [Natrialbaceae]|uniref:Uncharacterized protein n=1 Tax=Saliphagus infecundisoli TaxID=1849069 RepID=A0ABD5QLD7_9EURY|nr:MULTISPECIES: hypothetical protein [Natrialbaceae]